MKNASFILIAMLIANSEPSGVSSSSAEPPLNTVFLSEVLPNPKGNDKGNEWVKIINKNSGEISLQGFEIHSGKTKIKLDGTIQGNELKTIYIQKGSILNKNGDVKLIAPDGKMQDEALYSDAKDDAVYKKQNNGTWEWINPNKPPLKTKIKQTSKNSKNGDLSSKISISELLPNPKGKDNGAEWIEFFNNDDRDINLENWRIKTNKKMTQVPYFQIKSKEYKTFNFQLTNTGETFELYDFQNNLIDKISYENAAENKSYTKISIEGENPIWDWTSEITKAASNPSYAKLNGIILESPNEESFSVKSDDKIFQIFYKGSDIDPLLTKLTFTKDSEIEIIGEQLSDEIFKLKKYKILKQVPPEPASGSNYIRTIFFLGLILLATGLYKREFLQNLISRAISRKMTLH